MSRHRVLNLRRLRDAQHEGAELPTGREVVSRELSWLGGVVEVVTACRVGGRWERSIVLCSEATCKSVVALRRTGDACEWHCPACSSSGALVGWRDSPYDLTTLEIEDDLDRTDAAIFARLDELDNVRHCPLDAKLKLTLALSTLHADYVVIGCAEAELSELLCALEPFAGRGTAASRRLIDRFLARVDAALLACESRVEPAHTLH